MNKIKSIVSPENYIVWAEEDLLGGEVVGLRGYGKVMGIENVQLDGGEVRDDDGFGLENSFNVVFVDLRRVLNQDKG